MKSTFQIALEFCLLWECVHDKAGNVIAEEVPGDAGGLTKYGIDQRSHPTVDIRALTLEKASAIYYDEYWAKLLCPNLPALLGFVTFDSGVNCGTGLAARLLQSALGVASDGFIGPKTLKAADHCNAHAVALRMIDLRDERYRAIARGKNRKFLKGWLNRTAALRIELGRLKGGA